VLSPLERRSGDHCFAPRCREQHLQGRLEAFRDEAGRQVDESTPERFLIVVVPHRAGRLVKAKRGERRALGQHLAELASAHAGSRPVAPPGEQATPEPVPAVCGSCRGSCCYHGGRHSAFIDEDTIARFVAEHPDVEADRIPSAYLAHVPALHFEGSCLFHTREGCHLPRALRATLCNLYECRGLKLARERQVGPQDPLFIVARHDNQIVRGEFIDASGVRAVEAKP
jgi:hypothetical protein